MRSEHTFNDVELNNKFSNLKDNIKLLIIDKLRKENVVEFEKNTDYVAEYIRDNIGIGPQKRNPNSKYKIDAIKQSLNVNPSQPPSLRFLLGLCELFELSLDTLFASPDDSQMEDLSCSSEISDQNLHNRYHKYMLSKTPFYLYFLDTKKGIDIEEGEIEFLHTLNNDSISVKLIFHNYNKKYLGEFRININNPVGQMELRSNDSIKDESIQIMLIDPSVETTELIGSVGFMISQSADSIKKPCLNKVILSKKRIMYKDYDSRKWLQGLLNITPTGLLLEKDKFDEIIENKAVDDSIKEFLNVECKEHIFIDDPALWHRRMSENILDKKNELHELIGLLRHASISDRIFKLTEIDNMLVYEFLKDYDGCKI